MWYGQQKTGKISKLGKWVEESGEIKNTEWQGADFRGRCSLGM